MADTDTDTDAPADTDDAAGQDRNSDETTKWKALARKHEKESKALADRLKSLEDKDKSEVERLAEQVATLTKERDTALGKADRLEVAISKSLDEDRAQRISTAVKRLTGTTREELEADADELLPLLFPSDAGSDKDPAPRRPHEDLHGGGDPTEALEPDVRSIVESIPRGF